MEVVGKSGHAAEPEKGVDALEAATGILADLYALRKSYAAIRSAVPGIASPTLVVGLIKGGINTNVVPDNVDVPHRPPDHPGGESGGRRGDARRADPRVRAAVAGRDRRGEARSCSPCPSCRSRDRRQLVAALQRHGRAIVGEELRTHGVPIYTDARLYTAAGVPAVLYGAGPRTLVEANGHRADEKLALADLHKATEVVALALADLLTAG